MELRKDIMPVEVEAIEDLLLYLGTIVIVQGDSIVTAAIMKMQSLFLRLLLLRPLQVQGSSLPHYRRAVA